MYCYLHTQNFHVFFYILQKDDKDCSKWYLVTADIHLSLIAINIGMKETERKNIYFTRKKQVACTYYKLFNSNLFNIINCVIKLL